MGLCARHPPSHRPDRGGMSRPEGRVGRNLFEGFRNRTGIQRPRPHDAAGKRQIGGMSRYTLAGKTHCYAKEVHLLSFKIFLRVPMRAAPDIQKSRVQRRKPRRMTGCEPRSWFFEF